MSREEIQNKIESVYYDDRIQDIENEEFYDKYYDNLDDMVKKSIASDNIGLGGIIEDIFEQYVIQFYMNEIEYQILDMKDAYRETKRYEYILWISHFIYSTSDFVYPLIESIRSDQENLFLQALCLVNSSYTKATDYSISSLLNLEFSDEFDILNILEKEGRCYE
jgi:FKBP-type peptidyl-prolyl cis-trans isomerase (trigger factor)